MRNVHRWFWVEAVTAALAGGLAILTLFWHDWMELAFGVDPDHGNGSVEVWAVGVLVVVALAAGWAARRAWMARPA
jgi:hypothetical protein